MEKRQRHLLEAAEELIDEGFQLVPIGTDKVPALKAGEFGKTTPEDLTRKTLDMIRASKVTGMRIELGARGSIPQDDGTVLVPLAIEREGKASRAYRSRFVDAIARLGVRETWDALKDDDNGFVQDTGGGGRRWFFLVQLDSIDDLPSLLNRAEAHVAREKKLDTNGEPVLNKKGAPEFATVAELLTEHAIAAPSYGRVHPEGEYAFVTECYPDRMPILTHDQFALLGAVLAETTEGAPTKKGNSAIVQLSGRKSQRARDVSRLYNAMATDAQACELLLDAGWTIHSGEPGSSDEVFFSRPGAKNGNVDAKVGGGNQEGGVYVYTTSDAELSEEGYYIPFDLHARLLHRGDAEVAATTLLSDGVVELPTAGGVDVLRATNLVDVELHTMAAVDAQRIIVNALAEAENPRDEDTPLVLLKTDAVSDVQYLITPIPGLPPVRWARIDELRSLLLAVVQPCVKKYDQNGEVTGISYRHSIEGDIVRGIFMHLMNNARALPSAKILAAEPVLVRTHDGSLSVEQTSGYHKDTGVLLTIPHAAREFWAEGYRVSPTPTKAQAQAATDYLLGEIFVDFPFATAGDRARALAYLLTIVARHTLPTVPAWLFDAADRGSGKSRLGEVCRLIESGSTSAVSVSPDKRGDEENKKSVVGAVISGGKHLHVDEVPRGSSISSKVLTEIVTASPGSLSYRVLGGNDNLPIEGLTVTFAGNNVNIGGDFNRRTFPIRMEWTGAIAPHERSGFRHSNLLGWAAENRPTLLAACHTILLHGSQNPTTAPSVGSFEEWSEMILGSLTHVQMGDASVTKHIMDGRSEWTASNDSMVDDWGQFLAWFSENFERPSEIKTVRAKLNDVRKLGIEVELPPELFAQPGEMEQTVNRRWSDALRDMRNTGVILDGSTYKLAVETRGKKPARYFVSRVEYGEDGLVADAQKVLDVNPTAFLPSAPAGISIPVTPTDEIELDFS